MAGWFSRVAAQVRMPVLPAEIGEVTRKTRKASLEFLEEVRDVEATWRMGTRGSWRVT